MRGVEVDISKMPKLSGPIPSPVILVYNPSFISLFRDQSIRLLGLVWGSNLINFPMVSVASFEYCFAFWAESFK